MTDFNFFGPSDEFDPEGDGYDYNAARKAGMSPDADQHWGTVAPASPEDRKKFGLPDESYLILKGRKHKTWKLGEDAEMQRGFKIEKFGNRYYSIPREGER